MAEELKDQRVPIMMTASDLKALDDWMFENRYRSRGEAIRTLITKGIMSKLLDNIIKSSDQVIEDLITGSDSVKSLKEWQRSKFEYAKSLDIHIGDIKDDLRNEIRKARRTIEKMELTPEQKDILIKRLGEEPN